jgi:hypothetical protein
MFAGPALADSIAPSSFSATIGVGGVASVDKTVTVSAGSPTTAQVDIFFLSDTTGSMGSVIGSVQTNAGTILTNTAGFGNVQWGVGQYKDLGDVPVSQVQQTMTSTQASVTAAIGGWVASGGGDYPENGLQGLTDAATGGGWRVGSQKFVVMFGDAPFHTGPGYPTVASTLAALGAEGIRVIAVDSGSSPGGTTSINDAANGVPATDITGPTGGSSAVLGADIAALIQSLLTSSFATYSNVTLDLSEVPAGLLPSLIPASYAGTFTRDIDRLFGFGLSFTGLVPGVYDFNVYALVDGGRVATEVEHIVVTGGEVPLPGAAWLMLSGLVGLGALARRRRKQAA